MRTEFNTTNLHVEWLGSRCVIFHQLQKTTIEEGMIHVAKVMVDFNMYEEQLLVGHVTAFSRLGQDASFAFWKTLVRVSSGVATSHTRVRGASAIRWLREQGFLVEYNLIDFNNEKKLWQWSLMLDAPFIPSLQRRRRRS